jgi:hypothetical protein
MWFVVTKREMGIINVESEGRNFESQRSGFSNGMLMLCDFFSVKMLLGWYLARQRLQKEVSFILKQHVKGFFPSVGLLMK